MQELDRIAREVTRAAIEHGQCTDGATPSEAVVTFHGHVARALQRVAMDIGNEAMLSAGEFAVGAIRAGMVFGGPDTAEFIRSVGSGVRETGRSLSGPGSGPRF